MRESLPGYDTSYRHGTNPAVDETVDALNKIVMPFNCGIACLDEKGNTVQRYTENVVLELSENMPEDIRTKARAAALSVLQAMQLNKSSNEAK